MPTNTSKNKNDTAAKTETETETNKQPFANKDTPCGYPMAFDDEYSEKPRSLAELDIIHMSALMRDKPQWWVKVFNEEIVSKWRQEFLEGLMSKYSGDPKSGRDMEYHGKLFAYALAETRWRATQVVQGPVAGCEVRPAAVDGVFCLEQIQDADLMQQLLAGIAVLRARPAIGSDDIDRHPGTPQMIDLVHPSLYCYERNKTRVLESAGAEATTSPSWNSFLGAGIAEETKPKSPKRRRYWYEDFQKESKAGLQWLPSEFQVSADGKDCQIFSYINCLHPKEYPEMYSAVGKLFCQALPLLENVLAEASSAQDRRLPIEFPHGNGYYDHYWKEPSYQEYIDHYGLQFDGDYMWSDEYDPEEVMEIEAWQYENRKFLPPDVPDFSEPTNLVDKAVSLKNRPLQVIVKLASLELQPGESYPGGSWHVEGALDERIVATACCYLESDNISDDKVLSFRLGTVMPVAAQDQHASIDAMFGFHDGREGALVQEIGECSTRKGQILAWPNTHQHKVDPVVLLDSTKPGKRTILCFFLVDPTLRVRSTATVPPQQWKWYASEVSALLNDLGLHDDIVQENTLSYLKGDYLTYEQACERRDRLMEERKAIYEEGEIVGSILERRISLCEH